MSNNPIVTLLKIILQGGPIHIDEIIRYVGTDKNTVERNINQLNEYLKDHGLNQVVRNQNKYSLDYKIHEMEKFFSELNILSSEERRQILCIKLLLYGFLNLEKEREELEISRTTIIKDIKQVKKYLEEKNIQIESKNGRGIFLKKLDSFEIRRALGFEIIGLMLEKEFLCKHRRKLLKDISVINPKEYLEIYKRVLEEINCQASTFSFYLIYAMGIIEHFKKENFVYEIEEGYDVIEMEKIRKYVDKYSSKDINRNMKEFLVEILFKIKYLSFFEKEFKVDLEEIFNLILRKFSIKEEISCVLKENIKTYILRAVLKKRYETITVRKTPMNLKVQKVIEKILELLKEENIELIYFDVIGLAEFVIDILVEVAIKNNINVIILVKNYRLVYVKTLAKFLRELYPGLQIKVEAFLYWEFKSDEEKYSYDLVVGDGEVFDCNNFRKITQFNVSRLNEAIRDYILDKKLEADDLQ